MNVFDNRLTLRCVGLALTLGILAASPALAGPYSEALNDPTNTYDAPVPGWVGPEGDGVTGGSNVVNPQFLGWATGHLDYAPTPSTLYLMDEELAYHEPTANEFDVVVLGDLTAGELAAGVAPGEITMTFDTPIRNGVGGDFAVFENGMEGATSAKLFAELAYVEVSSDGVDVPDEDVNFVRFDSVSLTPGVITTYEYIDATNVFNLAGKHVNCGGVAGTVSGDSWGTPFDLDDLATHPDVIAGLVDLGAIRRVKIVDIPGRGDYFDGDGDPIDDDPIYDPWPTSVTGGFDLEALGVLNEWPDFDGDGDVDVDDIDLLCAAARAASDDPAFDLDNDGDLDEDDFVTMVETCVETTGGRGSAVGDFNLDGEINITDLQLMKASFGLTGAGFADGNANCDLVVDVTDLQVLKANFGFVAGAVPEPATLTLLAIAGAAGLARRRR